MYISPKGKTMKVWTFTFNGRTRGAIGITYPCRVVVMAETEDAAWLRVYDTHENCINRRLIAVHDARENCPSDLVHS